MPGRSGSARLICIGAGGGLWPTKALLFRGSEKMQISRALARTVCGTVGVAMQRTFGPTLCVRVAQHVCAFVKTAS